MSSMPPDLTPLPFEHLLADLPTPRSVPQQQFVGSSASLPATVYGDSGGFPGLFGRASGMKSAQSLLQLTI